MATDERVIKGLNMIDRFGTDEYLPRKLISMTYSDTQALFTDGEAAMYAMYSWAAGSLANEDDIGIMTWPSTSSDIDMSKVATIWGSHYSGYLVSSSVVNRELAVSVAESMAMEEAIFFNDIQKVPTSLDTGIAIDGQSELVRDALAQIENAEVLLPAFKLFIFTSEAKELHADLILNVFAGNLSPIDYANRFEPEWEENVLKLQNASEE